MKLRNSPKKSFVLMLLLVCVVFQSCLTMRMNTKKTKIFFDTSKTNFTDQTFDFEKHKIHYIQTGNENNPTLFFIHGSPGSWNAYKDYLKDTLLLKKYRMIAIDRPGFGYSNFRKAQNLATQSDWISRFIKSKDNQKPIILVGHSMGGPVITKLAVDIPNLYSHLVILAGAIDPDAETPEKWRALFTSFPLKYVTPGVLRPSNDELWWLKKDLIVMKPNLKNIISNVLIIHGTKDPLVPYSNVAFIQKEFVNAKSMTVIPIENANHFIPWEHYTEIRDALLNLKL
jgi:pimeloyl-ACP methyl ester carboxylesterase